MAFRDTYRRFDHATRHAVSVEPLLLTDRIERALVLLAYCIEVDGVVHIPLYEKLERDLAALKSQQDTLDRARRRLSDFAQTFHPEGDPLQELELQLK